MNLDQIVHIKYLNLVKFVMCTLVSRDRVLFCKCIKRQMYPGNKGTHDKLNQIKIFHKD